MLMLNRKLSEDRGNAVLNWLADNGVDRTRLTVETLRLGPTGG